MCETCINQSFSKIETLLRRKGTFDPTCFLYASLLRISKMKTVNRTLLQKDNFFQSSDKIATCLTRTQIKISGIPNNRELNWTFLSFSQKEAFFYTLKQQSFFLILFCSFEGVQYFWVELCIFFSKLLSATYQQLFCVTESDIGQEPSNHTPSLYELSVVWLRLSFGEVSNTCRKTH